MPFVATAFHTFALWIIDQNIMDQNILEASLRTAISRAYYAGYLLAAQRMQTKGWQPKGKGDDHGSLIAAMKHRGGRTRELGERLYTLLELRRHADYHLVSAATIGNDDCTYCKKVRESSSAESVVTVDHWEEVKEICERFLPRLEQL